MAEVIFCIGINYLFHALLFFITARKRSLGQGNVFIPVGQSVHKGWLPSMYHRSRDQPLGVCIQDPPTGTRKVGSTHPTGMLSCCILPFPPISQWPKYNYK